MKDLETIIKENNDQTERVRNQQWKPPVTDIRLNYLSYMRSCSDAEFFTMFDQVKQEFLNRTHVLRNVGG